MRDQFLISKEDYMVNSLGLGLAIRYLCDFSDKPLSYWTKRISQEANSQYDHLTPEQIDKSIQDFLNNKDTGTDSITTKLGHVREIRETHNAVTIYGMNDDGTEAERPIAEFSRPQNWGDTERWHYEFFRLSWVSDGNEYINNCHCYTDIKNPECGYSILFAQCVATILYPGRPPQLCGREYLDEDDFWLDEWGEMPPHYYPDEEEDWFE